jgi:chemotaxis protein histidine kinase CheA
VEGTNDGGGEDAGDASKTCIADVSKLMDEAGAIGIDVSEEMGEMGDIIETAESWATTVRAALNSDASEEALESLLELLKEAQNLSVTLKEEAMLRAEVEARQWANRVREALEPPSNAKEFTSSKVWTYAPLIDQSSIVEEKTALDAHVAFTRQRTPLKTLRVLLAEAHKIMNHSGDAHRWNDDLAALEKELASAVKTADAWVAKVKRAMDKKRKTSLHVLHELVAESVDLVAGVAPFLRQIVGRCTSVSAWILESRSLLRPEEKTDGSSTRCTLDEILEVLDAKDGLRIVIDVGEENWLDEEIAKIQRWLRTAEFVVAADR